MKTTILQFAVILLIFIGISVFSDPLFAQQPVQKKALAHVAIIMDDLGFNRQLGIAALAIPGQITYGVIPHSPNGPWIARQAAQQQKEVILHAPMSTIHDFPLGESGLTESMTEEDFHLALEQALASVPHISGVSNHMGSLLTQKTIPMGWTMSVLRKRGLYFIDSRTTPQSVAWQIARKHRVPSLKRDIFLDHERTPTFIDTQFDQLISTAKRRGYAVAIAHPYPETIAFLRANVDRLQKNDIALVSASLLVNRHSPNRRHIQATLSDNCFGDSIHCH